MTTLWDTPDREDALRYDNAADALSEIAAATPKGQAFTVAEWRRRVMSEPTRQDALNVVERLFEDLDGDFDYASPEEPADLDDVPVAVVEQMRLAIAAVQACYPVWVCEQTGVTVQGVGMMEVQQ